MNSLKKNFDHMCEKLDEVWKKMDRMDRGSEEYKILKQEAGKIEVDKRKISVVLLEMGNKDPYYMA